MLRPSNRYQPSMEELTARVTPSVSWLPGGAWQPDLEGGGWASVGEPGQQPPAMGWSGEDCDFDLPDGIWEGDSDWLTWLGPVTSGGDAGNGDDGADYSADLWTITSFGHGEADWESEVITLPIEGDASWWNWWGAEDPSLDLMPNPGWDFDWVDGDFPPDGMMPDKDISTTPGFPSDSDSIADLVFLTSQTGGPSPLTRSSRAVALALSEYWTAIDRTTVVTNLPAAPPANAAQTTDRGLQGDWRPEAPSGGAELVAPFRTATASASADTSSASQTPTDAVPSVTAKQGNLWEPFGKLPALA